MGERSNWTKQDILQSYVNSMTCVKELMESRRYGNFIIYLDDYKNFNEMHLVGLFTNYVPLEMKTVTYIKEDDSEVMAIEVTGLSKLFKELEEGEDTPFYDINTMEV